MINIVFVIGPQRTGTSWLLEQLKSQQTGIYTDQVGLENEFFFKEHETKVGRDKFLKKLSGKGKPILYVDICSLYFGHINSIQNILNNFPEAKFVYIHRDEIDRKKSFDEHRHFNKFSAGILGYNISHELYEVQSKYNDFSKSLIDLVGESNCLELNFSQLKETNGQKWIQQLSEFTGVKLTFFDKGVINASKKDSSLLKRIIFVPIRLLQKLKFQIFLSKIKHIFKKD